MTTFNNNYLNMLSESLVKKISVLKEIVRLNEEQNELLRSEDFDFDAFDLNVQAKADLIDELELLDEGFTALFDRVKKEIGDNKDKYADDIRRIRILIREITDLSVNIEAKEKRNKALADKQFNLIKKEVKEAKKNSSTASKYYKSMSSYDSTPQFVDKKY